MGKLWEWIKKKVTAGLGWVQFIWETLGLIRTLLLFGASLGIVLAPSLLNGSPTIWAFVYTGGGAGALLGYFVTVKQWKVLTLERQLELATHYLKLGFFCLFLGLFVFITLNPETAEVSSFIEFFYNIWVYSLPFVNFVIGIIWSCAAYFF